MATIQRQKRRTTRSNTSSPSPAHNDQQQQQRHSNPDELEELMLEPVDYDEPPTESLTTQSVRSLNNVCLTGLDGVLRHIILETACDFDNSNSRTTTTVASTQSSSQRQHERRPTDNVVASIQYSTQRLARATITMNNNNDTHNLTTVLSQVQHLLDEHLWLISSHTDLCRALLQMITTSVAAVVHDAGHLATTTIVPTTTTTSTSLHHVRAEIRLALASLPPQLTFSDKQLEADFYQRLETLSRLVNDDNEHPPAYQDLPGIPPAIKEEKPPQYDDSNQGQQQQQPYSELDSVLEAIDRFSHVTPRFNNQRVERQLRIARHPAAPRMLCDSIAQIQRASRFKLARKSSTTTPSPAATAAAGTRSNQVVDKHSLLEMTDLLVKSLHRPCFNKQRYHLSADKERDLFMNGLFNKVDRLEGRRLSNQDAEQPTPRLDELDQILNHICRAKRTQFDNQRATFTVHSS